MKEVPMRPLESSIFIRDFEVQTHIGVYEKERTTPQAVGVAVEILFENPHIAQDKIEETTDYAVIAKAIEEIAKTGSRKMVETFAKEIAQLCFNLESGKRTKRVTVSVTKYNKIGGGGKVGCLLIFARDEQVHKGRSKR